jgi:hypothetical protein
LITAAKSHPCKFFTLDSIDLFEFTRTLEEHANKEEIFQYLKNQYYYDLLKCLLPKRIILEPEPESEPLPRGFMRSLYDGWTDSFKGASLTSLCQYIEEQEREWDKNKDFAKAVSVIQSSGMGKSRLLSEFGKSTLSVFYTFRNPNETGYPPGDSSIRKLLLQDRIADKADEMAKSLLAATFQERQ